MSQRTHKRVLVALDCAQPSAEALRQLPRLLGPAPLELTGLYIEDEDLMRAARLPGLREISFRGEALDLSLDRLREDMARDLARIRSAFKQAADDLEMRCRFEIARGRPADALCAAASDSDFVLVSRALRASGLRPRHGPHFAPLLLQPKGVLLVNEPWESGTSVVVLGADPAAIATGALLAQAEALDLIVAVPRTAPRPRDLPEPCTVVHIADWSEDAIADLCLRSDARLLVLQSGESLDTAALLTRLMDRLPCSLLRLG